MAVKILKKTAVIPVNKSNFIPKPVPMLSVNIPSQQDIEDQNDATVSVSVGSRRVFDFYVGIDGGPGTCSMLEIYNFRMNSNVAAPEFTKEQRIDAVKTMLENIIRANSNDRMTQSKTFYLTTVPDGSACKFMDEVLADGELFTLVKTFHNYGGAINKLYISNA